MTVSRGRRTWVIAIVRWEWRYLVPLAVLFLEHDEDQPADPVEIGVVEPAEHLDHAGDVGVDIHRPSSGGLGSVMSAPSL